MMLSVLIPSLHSRRHLLARLLIQFDEQRTKGVEVLIEADNGHASTGAKRNKLLSRSQGCWCVFVDDDDQIAADYVRSILDALGTDPDRVAFGLDEYEDGRLLRSRVTPPHLSAFRSSIAREYAFPDATIGEDTSWNLKIERALKSMVILDRTLYYYHRRTDQFHEHRSAHLSSTAASN